MRSIPIALAAFVISGPAAAQSWQEYSHPNYAFSVTFPANPQVEVTTYQVADNRSVPAQVYTVRWNNSIFTITVADLAGASGRRCGVGAGATMAEGLAPADSAASSFNHRTSGSDSIL